MKKIYIICASLFIVACSHSEIKKESCCETLNLEYPVHFENRLFDVDSVVNEQSTINSSTINTNVTKTTTDGTVTSEVKLIPTLSLHSKVLFDFNKSNLSVTGKKIIHNFYNSVKDKNANINLTGSTDFLGSDDYNKKLALQRAIVVKNELIKLGINKNLISISTHLNDKNEELISLCNSNVKSCVAKDRNTTMVIELAL